jgi:hypothetical protein
MPNNLQGMLRYRTSPVLDVLFHTPENHDFLRTVINDTRLIDDGKVFLE